MTTFELSYRSPLLDWPGAVAAPGIDGPTAWHYGDPLAEQRAAQRGAGLLDQSHRDVLTVSGPERLGWLHAICSQHVAELADGESTESLVLSPKGHVEQHWQLTELGDQVWIDTEPGAADEVENYLLKMRFLKRVEPKIVTAEFAVVSLIGPQSHEILTTAGLPVPSGRAVSLGIGPGFVRERTRGLGFDLVIQRSTLTTVAERLRTAGATPLGSWAAAALRIVDRLPRLGFETDHRTIAHELGWIGPAVHLDKGCYRGQETVARVENLGQAPRRLVMIHLSGDSEVLPAAGTPVEFSGRVVGFIGTAAHHHELGPIALAVLKRTLGPDDQLSAAGDPIRIDRADAPSTQPRA